MRNVTRTCALPRVPSMFLMVPRLLVLGHLPSSRHGVAQNSARFELAPSSTRDNFSPSSKNQAQRECWKDKMVANCLTVLLAAVAFEAMLDPLNIDAIECNGQGALLRTSPAGHFQSFKSVPTHWKQGSGVAYPSMRRLAKWDRERPSTEAMQSKPIPCCGCCGGILWRQAARTARGSYPSGHIAQFTCLGRARLSRTSIEYPGTLWTRLVTQH